MPNTNLINTAGAKHFVHPELTVRLSPDDQAPSLAAHRSSSLKCTRVVQSAGGRQSDSATLQWKASGPLTNRSQPADFANMVDILAPNVASGMGATDSETRLILADYSEEIEQVDSVERLTATAAFKPYHFGNVFKGQRWWDRVNDEDFTVDHSPTFNPMVDGRVIGNRSQDKKRDDGNDAFLWISPGASRTLISTAYSEHADNETWDLKEAVLAMCWECNPDETHVLNPTRSDLDALGTFPDLYDTRLKIGQYLPFYLDALLQPLGFNWFVDYDTGHTANDPDARNEPQLRVFRRWSGSEKQIYFQAPGSVLDLNNSNCNQYRVQRSIGDSVNEVTVLGGFEKAEVTIELQRTWPETDDALTASDLDKSNASSQFSMKPNVWRLWAAGEGGDFNTTRVNNTTPDLSSVFDKWSARRRNIEEPFTWLDEENKERHPIRVEYSTDNGVTRKEAQFPNMLIAPDQIAVYFDGDLPPAELIDAGSAAKMWITGVVTGDSRLKHTATRQPHAVNGRVVTQTIEDPQRFRYHFKQLSGEFRSELSGAADTQDDSAAIQAFAEETRDRQDSALLSCQFTLPGIHLEYKIGDLITAINGRAISLDAASSSAPASRYPQVIQREISFEGGPRTVLTLDRGVTPRMPVSDFEKENRKPPSEVV